MRPPKRTLVLPSGELGVSFHYSPQYHDGWRREHAHRSLSACIGLLLVMAAAGQASRSFWHPMHRSLGRLLPWETMTPTGVVVPTI